MQRKNKIDWEMPEETILQRYKEVFPEKSEENLLNNIKYQKLIYEEKRKRKSKKVNDDSEKWGQKSQLS